jgi:acylphosphatase
MKTRAHVYISGRVQGVFFRSETRREATRRGVRGWVQNLPDGRVEAVFEGDDENVKALVEFCRHGPPDAVVTGVEVIWEDFTDEFRGFETRYW